MDDQQTTSQPNVPAASSAEGLSANDASGRLAAGGAAYKHHLAVILSHGDDIVATRVLDLEADYPPLSKELGYRVAARLPDLAGRPFRIDATLQDATTPNPLLRLSAVAAMDRANTQPLAIMTVPANNLAWLGIQLGERLELERGSYSVHLAALDDNHPWVCAAQQMSDEDFVITDRSCELRVPSQFCTEPTGRRQSIRETGSWISCVFSPAAWSTFLGAAARETQVERGWAAAGRVHLVDGRCLVVIEDELIELPAVATRNSLVTHGVDFYSCHRRMGGRLASYLHLHPRKVNETKLGPYPSGPDTTVAWNLDASTSLPVVLPIAMFGARLERDGSGEHDVAAHGFVNGLLQEVNLEVLADDDT